jgi:hypothetical protein
MRGKKNAFRPLSDRFWVKVDKRGPDECWEWIGHRNKNGYGTIRPGGRGNASVTATHVSYELANGPIPNGLWVLHRCDNPACVNPNHLFLGTHQDNVDDMIAKGRKRAAHGEAQHNSKLTTEQVIAIRQRYAAGNITMYQLAAEYGIGAGPICNIIHRKTWKHVEP